VVLSSAFPVAASGRRVFSLDQCADQYVLALAPRQSIVGLSMRASAPDSFLRAEAAGLPRRRASAEAILATRPDVIVRDWGGDARLSRLLSRRGAAVVAIDDGASFDAIRANIRRVAAALGQAAGGEALIARMDAKLAAARGAWSGRRAMYLTSAGFTAGPGTLVDAILTGAGLSDVASPGYHPVSLERLAIDPPQALVLGFFDPYGLAAQGWGAGHSGLVRLLVRQRAIASLPASEIACPTWVAADASLALAQARRR
jgi:iron complex transport system substrate-binding protein